MRRQAVSMAALSLTLLVGGCATPSQQMVLLQSENETLKKDVDEKASQILALTSERSRLQKELDYCNRRSDVLVKEKAARLDEASVLRKGIREFTEQVTKTLATYFQKAEIVDYLGNELLPRSVTDTQKNVLLVDLNNPARENGTLIGGRAWVTSPTRLHFCLLRLDPGSGKYTIAAMSPEVTATAAGLQAWIFDLPMAARKGDLMGVYAPEDVSIPYDDVDTGEVVAVPGSAKLNAAIAIVPGEARNKRSYSFGMVGYFEAAAVKENGSAGAQPAETGVPAK